MIKEGEVCFGLLIRKRKEKRGMKGEPKEKWPKDFERKSEKIRRTWETFWGRLVYFCFV